MINNVVLVSGIQLSDSVTHTHVSILFQLLFPFRLLHTIEQSSLCYTVGPCWLSILNIADTLYICPFQSPHLQILLILQNPPEFYYRSSPTMVTPNIRSCFCNLPDLIMHHITFYGQLIISHCYTK